MGGTAHGHGIMSMCTEYNWHLDAEAANVFLRNYDNVVIIPIEACWEGRMDLE